MTSIYDCKVEGIEGKEIDFAGFRGKKILLVNVASECGFTPQYQQLVELFNANKDNLIIVGFPTNEFGNQEPKNNSEIAAFCQQNYKVAFPLASKMELKSNPIYQWLSKTNNASIDTEVKWNFHKFLINESGELVASYPSAVTPLDQPILDWIDS